VDSEGSRATGLDSPAIRGTAPGDDLLHWHSHGTLLVVDDDPGVRELVTSILKRCGFTVLAAGDGQTALEIFRRCADQIRMVLLDFGLPDTDGETVLHSMRRIRPNLRAILCSGRLTDEAVDQSSKAAWSAIIGKPFRLIPFLQTVRQVLEG